MEAYTYKATVVSVYDGDTFHALIDQGLGIGNGGPKGLLVRLNGCNARELSDKPGGPAARDALTALLPAGTVVTMRSVAWDKYGGRVDAEVELPDGRDLVSVLAQEGWVALWDGVGTRPVPPYPPVPATAADAYQPTADEWLRRLTTYPRERQVEYIAGLLRQADVANRCFMEDHEGHIGSLKDRLEEATAAGNSPD